MKFAPTIACTLLALIHLTWASYCSRVQEYNSSIANLCEVKDLGVLWPKYEDVRQFYRCEGAGNPILETCPLNTLFDFTNQKCSKCSDYIPAQPCQALKGKTCKSFTPVTSPQTPAASKPPCRVSATYTTSFVPACDGVDLSMSWPNYKNISSFYICQGLYNPKIIACPDGTLFDYYKQSCVDCMEYVPALACEKLPFHMSNKCTKL